MPAYPLLCREGPFAIVTQNGFRGDRLILPLSQHGVHAKGERLFFPASASVRQVKGGFECLKCSGEECRRLMSITYWHVRYIQDGTRVLWEHWQCRMARMYA
jgi:hypothetical protein